MIHNWLLMIIFGSFIVNVGQTFFFRFELFLVLLFDSLQLFFDEAKSFFALLFNYQKFLLLLTSNENILLHEAPWKSHEKFVSQ